jgi:hypothetical protein
VAKRERAEEAKSIAKTAANSVGAGELVQGLESALPSDCPEQKLSASLGTWTKIANGCATNTITLKGGETEKEIELQTMEVGQVDMIIDGKIVAPDRMFNCPNHR